MMNKEDYVSLEVARLLKEKGFNEYCGAYYHLNWGDMTEEECFEVAPNYDFRNKDNGYRAGAPTLYEAKKWLIQNNIYVRIDIYGKWFWTIKNIKTEKVICSLFISYDCAFYSYEEALNAGILEALKLI